MIFGVASEAAAYDVEALNPVPGGSIFIVCYAIMLPARKSAFRAGFWPDCDWESTEIGPPAGRRAKIRPGRPISGPEAFTLLYLAPTTASLTLACGDLEKRGQWQKSALSKGFLATSKLQSKTTTLPS